MSHEYIPQSTNTQPILVSETPSPLHSSLQLKSLGFISAPPVATTFSLSPIQSISPASAPATTSTTEVNSPYGFTTVNADNTLMTNYQQLNIHWVRYQVIASSINWAKVDAAVAKLNAANIHIDFPIHCLTSSCFSNPPLPRMNQLIAFATRLATRYNGKNGHGFIDAYEIGNEEFDFYPPSTYPPYLKAGCQAVKLASPTALCGMYGTFRPNLSHYSAVVADIFKAGDGQYMDFMNFHYYVKGQNPTNPGNNMPTFNSVWQAMKSISIQYNFPNMPIWVTEAGWSTTPISCCSAVSPAIQAQYLQYIMDQARTSYAVQRVFWFTIDYGNQADTIYPLSGPLPAFTTYQNYVNQYPTW